VGIIARRRGATVKTIDGGRILSPGPARPPEAAAPGPAGQPPADPEQVRRIRERFAELTVDDYARQERAAVREFDGGLTREEAEHAAGLR
jgi:hypothetical protein